MLLCIPEVLTKEQVAYCRQTMDRTEWVDGRVTAGAQSGSVKRNMQLPEGSPAAQELGDMVLGALARSPLFISAAIPQRIFPPLFNSHGVGHSSARTWTARLEPFQERRLESVQTCPSRFSWPSRRSMTVAS